MSCGRSQSDSSERVLFISGSRGFSMRSLPHCLGDAVIVEMRITRQVPTESFFRRSIRPPVLAAGTMLRASFQWIAGTSGIGFAAVSGVEVESPFRAVSALLRGERDGLRSSEPAAGKLATRWADVIMTGDRPAPISSSWNDPCDDGDGRVRPRDPLVKHRPSTRCDRTFAWLFITRSGRLFAYRQTANV